MDYDLMKYKDYTCLKMGEWWMSKQEIIYLNYDWFKNVLRFHFLIILLLNMKINNWVDGCIYSWDR